MQDYTFSRWRILPAEHLSYYLYILRRIVTNSTIQTNCIRITNLCFYLNRWNNSFHFTKKFCYFTTIYIMKLNVYIFVCMQFCRNVAEIVACDELNTSKSRSKSPSRKNLSSKHLQLVMSNIQSWKDDQDSLQVCSIGGKYSMGEGVMEYLEVCSIGGCSKGEGVYGILYRCVRQGYIQFE